MFISYSNQESNFKLSEKVIIGCNFKEVKKLYKLIGLLNVELISNLIIFDMMFFLLFSFLIFIFLHFLDIYLRTDFEGHFFPRKNAYN
jgi:hypothetical protein